MTADLPPVVRDIIAAVPPAGTGVHPWLFRSARHLHAHRSEQEIVELLAAQVEGCGRHVPRREIEDAVRNSHACAWRPGTSAGSSASVIRKAPWPAVNQLNRSSVIASGFTLADLWEASPIRFDSDAPGGEEIVDVLFPGNPLLCVGTDQRHAETRPREEFRGRLAAVQFVVPSPMSSPTGLTQDGRESTRCLGNVGPRRFIVVECDSGTIDEQAAIIGHLSDRAPIVLAVHSGGKSLHGWFRAHDDEQVTRRFFTSAVSLGADPATWTRCQFVRMPGGLRDNGRRQTVWFFNPGVTGAH